MRRLVPTFEQALALVQRIDPKYRPVWERLDERQRAALALYFLAHFSRKATLSPTRPRVVKWYCPFADQARFPSGHRYCINVYTGCAHGCVYCYAMSYSPESASCKGRFQDMIARDMADLEQFDVPPAPVHLSNSTDPFQPLERTAGHTRIALEQILAHRRRFTSVVLLTRNPLLPVELGYLDLLRALAQSCCRRPRRQDPLAESADGHTSPTFFVEVSLAFWREEARQFYDPNAPPIAQRIEGLRALSAAGIPLVLRIDPLLPRSPIRDSPPMSMADLGLVEAQTLEDLDNLVALARDLGVRHVVWSVAKIVKPRGRPLSPTVAALRPAYTHLAGGQKLVFRGGSWRLPDEVARQRIIEPFLAICRKQGVAAKFCMANLLGTK
jgi:DNA repair photolyase